MQASQEDLHEGSYFHGLQACLRNPLQRLQVHHLQARSSSMRKRMLLHCLQTCNRSALPQGYLPVAEENLRTA